MRIESHPILSFPHKTRVSFTFDGQVYEGYEGEPIAVALHDAGVRVLSHGFRTGRPRGLYCAIGNCSSCLMTVNGEPNVRICIEKLTPGAVVESQRGRGSLHG
jgi:predicted molibdopterin-dependent oxidoreductase YjgC